MAGSEVPESIVYNIPHVPTQLFFSWVIWLGIIVLSIIVIRKAKFIPGKIQVVFEMIFDYVTGLADELIGPDAHKFYPLFLGLFIFILVCNIVSLIPGLAAPTADPNLTFGLAIMVFVYFIFLGFKYNGLGYFKQFLGPPLPWYMFPISILLTITEVISFFTRPFSLGLRLFANIFSKELFLLILAKLLLDFFFSKVPLENVLTLMPFLLRPVILLLGLIVAFIQALVFMVLTMSYIAGAVRMEHH